MKSINTFISHLLLFREWVREWCLKPLDQLFSHNMAKPIYFWWDDVVFFYSQAHGAWISFPPPPFSLLPPPPFFQNFHIHHSFFKIFIIIRFSSFDNISRRHTSWIIRVFCVHSFSTFWKRNDLYEKFEKKGGSREKGGGGNEIHAPCACAFISLNLTYFVGFL